jgi:hypothetical protein
MKNELQGVWKKAGRDIHQNGIHEEINNRLYSQNTFYDSVQNILSFRLLSKTL